MDSIFFYVYMQLILMDVIIGTTLHEQLLLLILSPYLATRGKLKRKLVIIDVSFSFLLFLFSLETIRHGFIPTSGGINHYPPSLLGVTPLVRNKYRKN
jgi:hypothetical protein